MQLNKMLSTFGILILILTSCNGHSQDKSNIPISKWKETTQAQLDFFDKKYFEAYELAIDESNMNDHPFFRYLDCSNEGYFSVHFVPKVPDLSIFWKKEYYKDIDFNSYDFERDNKKIEGIINKNFIKYNIFSYVIKKEYLNTKNGCTKEGVFLNDNSLADIYLYNQQSKKWELIKSVKSKILPPYVNNEYFTLNVPHLFLIIPEEKKLENKDVAYSYDYDLDKDGIKDKIILYKNEKETDEFEKNHFGLSMEIKKGLSNSTYQIWCKNNSIIPQNKFNCATEGFNTIVFKDNYFTIENQICSDYIEISSYITFKVVGRDIILHKYGETYFDKADHEKQIPSKVWKSKDFGDVKFEKVTDAFLIKLSQTIPKK